MDGQITKPVDQSALQQMLIELLLARCASDNSASSPAYGLSTDQMLRSDDANQPATQNGQRPFTVAPDHVGPAPSHGRRCIPIHACQASFFADLPLLDATRLNGPRTSLNGSFQEFLQSMFNNLARRNRELHAAVDNSDNAALLEALHSLMGLSGYLGAHALHMFIRERQNGDASAGRYSREVAWLETMDALIALTVQVLRSEWVEPGVTA